MNEPVTIQLTEADVKFLRIQQQELRQFEFLNRGKTRTTQSQIDVEAALKFVDRLLAQIP